jgi:uncharacterized membrane-anchored protein
MQKVKLLPQSGPLLVAADLHFVDGETDPASFIGIFEPLQPAISEANHGRALIASDFAPDTFGFVRIVVVNRSRPGMAAGRLAQRLLEIETYRMLALLGQPVASEVGRWLSGAENRLAELMDHIGQADSPEDERAVLADLSKMAAEVEHSVARTTFRFGASCAYQNVVVQRIDELREVRVAGYPTLHEFMQRRFLPAMNTCAAMARRQEDLSGRVARNSQLLRTRVDIELERQNQELLAQMNQRAQMQLRLQETVEGLSIAAITYYASQLIYYLAKGGKSLFPALSPEVVTAASIPVIAVVVFFAIKRLRQALADEAAGAQNSHTAP